MMQQDDDEDSENDADFVPEEMDDDDEEDAIEADETIYAPHLSLQKRKAVDEAFEKLFGYPFGTTFVAKRRRTASHQVMVSKRESMLADIFGPSVAAHLMATSSMVRDLDKDKHVTLPLTVQETVTEIKRFAGRNIVMEKQVTVHQSASTTASATTTNNNIAAGPTTTVAKKPPPPPTATGGLDSVLKEIEGPGKLSTVAKTSADWDSFKSKHQVQEELEKKAQSNQAFLVKQDFLKRVDERRFEHERKQRDKERSARNKK
jgi:hypothetical protein